MHLGSYDVCDESEDKQEEKEADLFASHFLMPKEGFDQEWEETAGLPFPDRVMIQDVQLRAHVALTFPAISVIVRNVRSALHGTCKGNVEGSDYRSLSDT
jgi:Zn-dependent peptidase ImmA (M78 family)